MNTESTLGLLHSKGSMNVGPECAGGVGASNKEYRTKRTGRFLVPQT